MHAPRPRLVPAPRHAGVPVRFRAITILSLIGLIFASLPAVTASASTQPGTSFTSNQFGYQVSWQSPWVMVDQSVESLFEMIVLKEGNAYASFVAFSPSGGQIELDNATDVLNFWVIGLVAQVQDARVLRVDRAADVPWAELSFTCPLGPARSLVEVFSLPDTGAYLVSIVESPEPEVESSRQLAAAGIMLNGSPFMALDRPEPMPPLATPVAEAAPAPGHGGGPANSGAQPGPAPSGMPAVRWAFPTHDEFVGATSVVISPEDGLAFTSSNAVYAIDLATGQEVWAYHSDSGLGFVAPLALADGVLYAGCEDGAVDALDPATGAVRWRTILEPMLSIAGGPVVEGDSLFVTTMLGTVHSLDTATGAIRWERQVGKVLFGQPALAAGYLILPAPTIGDLAFNGALALDARTGKTVWAFKTPAAIRPMPVISGGTVYLGADDGIVYAIDLASGILRWMVATGAPVSSAPAVFDGVVYAPSAGSVLGAYDAETGATRWTVPVAVSELGGTTVAPAGDGSALILVGDDTGVLHAFDTTGAEAWTVRVANASLTRWRSTVLDGTIYASGQDGTLYALSAQGPPVATPPATETPTAAPAQRPGDLTLPTKGEEAPSPLPTPTPIPTPTPSQPQTPTASVEYADAGMVGPGHYVNSRTGTEVRWDTTVWELDTWFDPPVVTGTEGDDLYIVMNTHNGVSMGIYIYPSYGDPMEDIVRYASADTNIADVFGPTAEIVLSTAATSRGAMVLRDPGDGFETWMVYSEFYLVNDGSVLVEVQLVAPASIAKEAITAAQEQITLNGEPVMTFYASIDVVAAVGP